MAVDAATEVLMPGSEDEAIAAFGDGADVVVVGGGTIVLPDMTYRRLRPAKALMLGRAGLSGVSTRRLDGDHRRDDAGAGARRDGSTARAVRRQRRRRGDPLAGDRGREPLRRRGPRGAARRPPGRPPRARRDGSLRSRRRRRPRSRSRTSSRSAPAGSSSASASTSRPPARSPASTARTRTTTRRSRCRALATPTGRSAWRRQELAHTDNGCARPRAATADAALDDVTPHDDALASAWYRAKVLPVLVRRVLSELEESA